MRMRGRRPPRRGAGGSDMGSVPRSRRSARLPGRPRYHPAAMPDTLQRLIAVVWAGLTLPLLGALGLAVRLDSPGPAIYAGRRVGEGGRIFTCHKLRTMRAGPPPGGPGEAITLADDPRVTHLGRLLRRTRLDDPLQQEVVRGRPGITGLAQLLHLDEAAELGGPDPVAHYRAVIQPRKLRLDAAYLRHQIGR